MQEVMLVHALSHTGNDTLFNQFCYRIDEDIDVAAFRAAWEATVQRHAALRTAFVWEGVKQPQQVVRQTVKLPFEVLDWRDRDDEAQSLDLATLREQDRVRGFDLRRAPLMRFALIRTDARRWIFVWSSHHLIVDRWCLGAVLHDVGSAYSALSAGKETDLRSAPSFRDYVSWIQRQDSGTARSFWRRQLAGLTRASALTDAKGRARSTSDSAQLSVSGRVYQDMVGFARDNGTTVGAVVQGAWALTLNGLTGAQDVMFGATSAGRPPDLPNVDAIVGSFINNVPVRIPMPADIELADWLRGIQARQLERSVYEYLSPAQLHACSEFADSTPLFDCLLVWLARSGAPPGLPMLPLSMDYATAFPLTLSIEEGDGRLELRLEQRDCLAPPLDRVLARLAQAVAQIAAARPDTRLGDLNGFELDPAFRTGPADTDEAAVLRPEPAAQASPAAVERELGRETVAHEEMQEALLAEWQRVLGVSEIGPDVDFFAAGGESIQAALLHTRIEAAVRKTVPLLTLFKKPTLRGMATTLLEEKWPLKLNFVTSLRTKGSGTTLFCIASPEVNTLGYSLLARYLSPDQKVDVIQAPPESDEVQQLHPAELGEYAKRYLAAMRAIQPTGPYKLLSMCAGSHITMEMARMLEADNEEIAFFGIVNTWALYTVSRRYYLNRLGNILRYYRGRLRNMLPAAKSSAANASRSAAPSRLVLPAEEQVGLGSPWIRDVGFASRDPGRPRAVSEITVFRLQRQQSWRVRDASLGWSRQSERVRIVTIDGDDHQAIMREPRVRELAAALTASLGADRASRDTDEHAPKNDQNRAALC